ncbi:MAG: type II toxin-antitoxin system VapC family toxin [Candidatus Sericytochromatia bacterium]|nr:type II toxin-antitoxin system VapC family toxin [Candidatus Tanganyikabacteria bacterium]
MILLDTCTLLWLSDRDVRLPARVEDAIRKSHPSERYVSAISAFEIGWKHELGKLQLPLPPRAWFEEACARRGIRSVPITESIAIRASQLPRHHRDPADRFIISTASELRLRILTPDPLFSPYEVDLLWG